MKRTDRPIDKIILHCSATPPKMDIGVKEIRQWHTQKGWSDIGYHFVIRRNGDIENGRDINRVGAHVRGHNTGSIGICMIGGVDDDVKTPRDNFTPEQWKSARNLLRILGADYKWATVHGHNEFASKACPSFDVQKEITKGRLK